MTTHDLHPAAAPASARRGLLHRTGRAAAAHPWRTMCAWLVGVVAAFALAGAFGGATQDDYDVPQAPSQHGIDLLRQHLTGGGNASALVVAHTTDGSALDDAQLQSLRGRLAGLAHVATVTPPRFSDDRDTALLTVNYDVPTTHPDLMGHIEPLEGAIEPSRAEGLQVELGGELPATAAAPMQGRGELVGILAALVILVLLFGSVVAAGIPVVTAVAGLLVGSAGIGLLASTMHVSGTAPTVASMVGLGVGIDYALLLVTRYVEYLRAGHDRIEAAGFATATAGRSVVLAGSTVLVSLMGLRLVGLSTYSSFGFATAIAVVAVMAASLTLVPALCGLGHRRLRPRAVRRGGERSSTPWSARWAGRVGRRPLPWVLAASLVMITLALPLLGMRSWPQDDSSQSRELTTRRAYDLLGQEFGPGSNDQIMLVADRSQVAPDALADLPEALATVTGIASVTPRATSADGAITVFDVQPEFGPTDRRTTQLVTDLRAVVPAGVEVTGETAMFVDVVDILDARLGVVIAFVVGVSVLLLGMMFRSLVVPLKAAAMNLLSIGAAYGVVTAVFQWGWGAGLLGLDHSMPVSSWLPVLMFAVLFGLSMDYEVFLLSRVREDWLATGDARGSVIRGLAGTGRVISAAAAIMVAVFLGFASELDVVVKQLGIGMAVAIALDATVVRLVLVPATMAMLGRWNWWMPRWLDRLLPSVAAEAHLPATLDDDPGSDERLLEPAGV